MHMVISLYTLMHISTVVCLLFWLRGMAAFSLIKIMAFHGNGIIKIMAITTLANETATTPFT